MTWKKPTIKHGKLTKWNWTVHFPKKLKLGKNTDIGAFTFIDARNGVEIEDNVLIGGGCFIYSFTASNGKKGKIVLKKGCKIGANTVILPGVTVGKNTTVGACSLINKDIPANVVAFGIPCKVKKGCNPEKPKVFECKECGKEIFPIWCHKDCKDSINCGNPKPKEAKAVEK